MGKTFAGLGRHEVADTLLHQALAEYTRLYGSGDVRTAAVLGDIGNNFRQDRAYRDADSLLHQEWRVRAAAGPIPDSVLADMMAALSATRREAGDIDSSLALAERAVAIRRQGGDTGAALTGALGALAFALRGANRLDSAEVVYRLVLERQQRVPNPNAVKLATTHNNLGYLYRVRNDLPAAEQSYREALRLANAALGEGHNLTQTVMTNLLAALAAEGKDDDVERLSRQRIAAAERQWPDGSWRVGQLHLALGRFFLTRARPADAVAPLRAGLASYRSFLGPTHAWTAVAQADLGLALSQAGRKGESGRLLDQAYRIIDDLPGDPNPEMQGILRRLITALERGGDTSQAEHFRRLLPAS